MSEKEQGIEGKQTKKKSHESGIYIKEDLKMKQRRQERVKINE